MDWVMYFLTLCLLFLAPKANAVVSAPKGLRVPVDTIANNGFWIEWNSVRSSDSYKVVVSYSAPKQGTVSVEEDISHTFTIVDGLLSDTEYIVAVFAVKAGEESPPAILVQRTDANLTTNKDDTVFNVAVDDIETNTTEESLLFPGLLENACYQEGKEDKKLGRIFVVGKQKILLDIPKNWIPGMYRCTWEIIGLNLSNLASDVAMHIEFSSRFTGSDNIEFCIGDVIADAPLEQYHFGTFRFCSDGTPKIYPLYKTPNTVRLQLELNMTSGGRSNDHEFYFDFSHGEDPNLPKRDEVSEIIKKSRNPWIKDFNFAWEDARKFCRRKYRGKDLCVPDDDRICQSGNARFDHSKFDQPIQYFPVLQYNTWMSVRINASECSLHSGPPVWGTNERVCPDGGCNSKSYIYCCQKDGEELKLKPIKKQVYVTSGRSSAGQPVYRVAWYSDHDEAWKDYWKVAGRISGDVSQFEIFEGYSVRSETAIHFCQRKVSDLDAVENNRFKLSLRSCKNPWSYFGSAYATRKPRKGMVPIYFGQSSKGDGTRISLTPPCCEYDDPDESFMLYGIVKKIWIPELGSKFCKGASWFNAKYSGNISSENNIQQDYSFPLLCSWRIIASEGCGIFIQYESRKIHDDCKRDYLEFSNPISNTVLGRVCGSSSGNILSDDRVVEVKFVLENFGGSFSFSYEEVPRIASMPIEYKTENVQLTWMGAKKTCTDNALQLCSKIEICPTGKYPAGGLRSRPLWLPVRDKFNEWIWAGQEPFGYETCTASSINHGPPNWGIDPKLTVVSAAEHDTVYCCDRPPLEPPSSEPVKVIVGLSESSGYNWFGRSEDWETPSYIFNYDYPYSPNLSYRVYPWKPPSTFSTANEIAVDYIIMSSEYESQHFEQTVYFCSKSSIEGKHPFGKIFRMSLDNCNGLDRVWKYEFHLYAGKKRSEKATTELYVGQRSVAEGIACCEGNKDKFIIYVISAGQIDSYVHPGSSLDVLDV